MIWAVLFICAFIAAICLTAPLLPAKDSQQKLQISLFIALFIGASLGTYNAIGAPHLSHSLFISQPSKTQPEPIETKDNSPAQIPSQQVSPEQISPEQINAMVNGLAARLADNPEDPAGWTRLIRSRIVLGDIAQLVQDHKAMSKTYKTRPEIVQKISQESGFNTFAAQLVRQNNLQE